MSKVVLWDARVTGASMRRGSQTRVGPRRGFVLLAVLASLFIVALSAQGVLTYVSEQARREREAELIQIGEAYAKAIGAYYSSTPGAVKKYPAALDDLLEDRRFVVVKRHLRRIYPDPILRADEWGLVRAADGGITGVYSRSTDAPIRSSGIDLREFVLPPASRYSDWQFVFQPPPAAVVKDR